MKLSYHEEQYVLGQSRLSYKKLFKDFELLNEEARKRRGWTYDLPYGKHPRETIDLSVSENGEKGLFVYFHAGYWQSRDKRQFHFIAPALNDAGYDVALVSYPLCPEVSVGDIVESVIQAPPIIQAQLPNTRRGGHFVVGGHSAGAHLAVELAIAASQRRGPPTKVDGVIAISGIYDLQPLVDTSLNLKLQLTTDSAKACSPLQRVTSTLPPARFIVGGGETDEFHRQGFEMAEAWSAHGNSSQYIAVPRANHFTVLSRFQDHGSSIRRTLDTLVS